MKIRHNVGLATYQNVIVISFPVLHFRVSFMAAVMVTVAHHVSYG